MGLGGSFVMMCMVLGAHAAEQPPVAISNNRTESIQWKFVVNHIDPGDLWIHNKDVACTVDRDGNGLIEVNVCNTGTGNHEADFEVRAYSLNYRTQPTNLQTRVRTGSCRKVVLDIRQEGVWSRSFELKLLNSVGNNLGSGVVNCLRYTPTDAELSRARKIVAGCVVMISVMILAMCLSDSRGTDPIRMKRYTTARQTGSPFDARKRSKSL